MEYKEEDFINECKKWLRTPWMHGVACKGYRTDCIQFVIYIAKQFQWIPQDYDPPKYRIDWHLHNTESILENEIAKFCNKITLDEIEIGDIILIKTGKCASHASFYIGEDKLIESHILHGVHIIDIKEYSKKITSIWRIINRPRQIKDIQILYKKGCCN